MIFILVRFMQIGRARESWQIYHTALVRIMDLQALACTSNLHEPHQNKNHSLNEFSLLRTTLFILKYISIKDTIDVSSILSHSFKKATMSHPVESVFPSRKHTSKAELFSLA